VLIDTGASANFISHNSIEKIIKANPQVRMAPNCLTLKLADSHSISTRGTVELHVRIQTREALVQFHIVDNLAYPIILGCTFLRQERIILRFDNNLTDDLNLNIIQQIEEKHNKVYLNQDITLPPFHQGCVECCIESTIDKNYTYIMAPEESLLTQQGLLIAHSIIDINTQQTSTLIANITKETIHLKKFQQIGYLQKIEEVLMSNGNTELSPNESSTANHSSSSLTRQASIQAVHAAIPKLDINFQYFNDDEVAKISATLLRHTDIFDTAQTKYGAAKGVQHKIDTGNAIPTCVPPHRVSPKERQIIMDMTNEMLTNGVIQPSVSPWASPIVLVKKKDGKQRFCIDFRQLNKVTIRDVYPIPRIEDCLTALGGNCWFSTFDMHAGFWQIEMLEQDKQKTAFIVDGGLYEFNVMPFGLTNATATFQRYMDMVLAGLKWTSLLVYLDDVCIFAKTIDQHLERLEEAFHRFRQYNLKLNAAKCHVLQKEFTYLGHIVTETGIKADIKKINAVVEMPQPKNVKQLRSFLGLCNYYRKFIKDYTSHCTPLYSMLSNEFVWTREATQAFADLKKLLTQTPMLHYPDFSQKFKVSTDASEEGIGAVLSQDDVEGNEKVI
jgi:hypothetical protein